MASTIHSLTPTKAPNLQVPPGQYNAHEMQQLVNQLKLYLVANDALNTQLIQLLQSNLVSDWVEP